MDRDFVWEADYGDRAKVNDVAKKLLAKQNAQSLQCLSYYVNNNPYNLEFYISVSYDKPTEEDILYMKQSFEGIGLTYRNDITMNALWNEIGNRRFQVASFCDEVTFDIQINGLFLLAERGEFEAKGYIRKPFTINKEVFLSHSSQNKERVRALIPYLNATNIPVWFDEYSIQGGENLRDRIKAGMEESTIIVFWVSKEFVNSEWCREEVEMANTIGLKQIHIIDGDVDVKDLGMEIFDDKYIKIKDTDAAEYIVSRILNSIK